MSRGLLMTTYIFTDGLVENLFFISILKYHLIFMTDLGCGVGGDIGRGQNKKNKIS